MRDTERIPTVVKAIEALWLMYPDLRLWQIIEIIHHKYRELYGNDSATDPFFVEDDKWLKVIQSFKEV